MHQKFEKFEDFQQEAPNSELFEQLFTSYLSNEQETLRHELEQIGDLEKCLNTDKSKGIINEKSLNENLEKYGSNGTKTLDQVSLISEIISSFYSWISIFIIIAFSDFIFQIISKDDMYYPYAWIEGFFVFILLVSLTLYQSYKTYQTKSQSYMLESLKKQSQTVRVMRFGQQQQILDSDLVVGDILFISEGQSLSVDGILLEAYGIAMDESAITGIASDVQKSSLEEYLKTTSDFPLLISGSQVITGEGKMIVLAVGQRSSIAKVAVPQDFEKENNSQVNIDLSQLLNRKLITFIQITVFNTTVILLLKTLSFNNLTIFSFCACLNHLLLYSIFIIGLVNSGELIKQLAPLALAQIIKRLLRDNNLVRKLSSVEKLGQVDYICIINIPLLSLFIYLRLQIIYNLLQFIFQLQYFSFILLLLLCFIFYFYFFYFHESNYKLFYFQYQFQCHKLKSNQNQSLKRIKKHFQNLQ